MQPSALPVDFMEEMASVLRILAHAYRLRIVERLDLRGPAPGHQLLAELGGTQGALSQHVNKLRQAGVLRAERRGKEVWYALANPDALTILNCMRKRQRAGE
jgi:DNA-binding transcriptional ArsR family regulator